MARSPEKMWLGNRTITGAGLDMTARDNFAASGEHQALDSPNPAHELRKEYLPWSGQDHGLVCEAALSERMILY
jgi:hypothetical protein